MALPVATKPQTLTLITHIVSCFDEPEAAILRARLSRLSGRVAPDLGQALGTHPSKLYLIGERRIGVGLKTVALCPLEVQRGDRRFGPAEFAWANRITKDGQSAVALPVAGKLRRNAVCNTGHIGETNLGLGGGG